MHTFVHAHTGKCIYSHTHESHLLSTHRGWQSGVLLILLCPCQGQSLAGKIMHGPSSACSQKTHIHTQTLKQQKSLSVYV